MKNRLIYLAVAGLAGMWLAACGRQDAADPARPESATLRPPVPRVLQTCPGLLNVERIQGNEQSGSVSLVCGQAVQAITDYYLETLAADGWIPGTVLAQNSEQHLQFNRDGRFLRFQIGPGGAAGTARVLIAWHQPAGARASNPDADLPDPVEQEPDHFREQSIEW
ncbi:MAG: hypothetical protein KBC66_02310 [Kiritimatiellae bacterium]|nr:hypothetical protein [Kiritimatiellia bacterium]NLD89325.1 hypothetical protein [Lentisphaerota bacterium]HPC19769.1 hypothetical protein [Kiritimatiellia bacterium]HQN80832.1 hypothetical protein [Kiritimatiellia bacterium]HQQ60512.1 hypothetical protein [Kiritimatiellia bacterium]